MTPEEYQAKKLEYSRQINDIMAKRDQLCKEYHKDELMECKKIFVGKYIRSYGFKSDDNGHGIINEDIIYIHYIKDVTDVLYDGSMNVVSDTYTIYYREPVRNLGPTFAVNLSYYCDITNTINPTLDGTCIISKEDAQKILAGIPDMVRENFVIK